MPEFPLPTVRVADGNVYFNGEPLPYFITEDGVRLAPGGKRGFNRLTVTFLVGEVLTEGRPDV